MTRLTATEVNAAAVIGEVIRCDRIDGYPAHISAQHVISGLRRGGFVISEVAQRPSATDERPPPQEDQL